MAETFTLKTGLDAWVSPQRNGRFGDQRLYVHSTANAYIFFNKPMVPDGSVITSAVLRIYPVSTAVATVVPLTVHRLTAPFDPNALVWTNLPTVGAQVGTQSRQWYPTGGPPFEIDLTTEVQAMVGGQAWYGWRLTSTGTNTEQAVWGGQSATPPSLEITYTVPPNAPIDLWPNNNSTVYAAKPTLTWVAPGGRANTIMSYQVQVAADSAFTTSLYTSNETFGSASLYDLNTASPAFTALTNGQSRYWRVRIKNDMGVWSAYSAAAQFTYATAPALTITAPGASTNVPVPTVTWTFGGTVAAYQVMVEIPTVSTEDRAVGVIYDSGIQYGAATSMAIPQGVFRYVSPQQYRIRLRVWASGSQIVSITGRPTYFETTATTAWVPSGMTAPTQIQVTQYLAPMPWWTVRWEYTAATVPDYFVVRLERNGIWLSPDAWVVPATVREGATNWYNWTHYNVRARADVKFEVFAYKAGTGTSAGNPTLIKKIVNIMPVVAAYSDPANIRFAMVNAKIESNLMEMSDVVRPIHGDPILVNWSYGKMMGSATGLISWDAPLDPGSFNAEDMFNDFLWIRKNPRVFFVWQDQAIDAYIYNCNFTPIGRPDGKTDWLVTFDWLQTSA